MANYTYYLTFLVAEKVIGRQIGVCSIRYWVLQHQLYGNTHALKVNYFCLLFNSKIALLVPCSCIRWSGKWASPSRATLQRSVSSQWKETLTPPPSSFSVCAGHREERCVYTFRKFTHAISIYSTAWSFGHVCLWKMKLTGKVYLKFNAWCRHFGLGRLLLWHTLLQYWTILVETNITCPILLSS